jgi:dTDP-4-amino-4,6-dideoxygalactose transaminase
MEARVAEALEVPVAEPLKVPLSEPLAYVDLAQQFGAERERLLPKIDAVLSSGQWVGGEAVEALETAIGAHCGSPHVVAVGSGTDALILSLRALGIGSGDEVITVPNSFVSTTAAIVQVGAHPVFVDVGPDQNIDVGKVEDAITHRTRALLPVHLTGRVAAMPDLVDIARRHDLVVVEDAAQAFGAKLGGQQAGCFGEVGCFSAHPLKNLNAAGDAGFVVTSDAGIAARLRRLRNNGHADRNTVLEWGTVSRLDALQAVVLQHRLEGLEAMIEVRRRNAAFYQAALDPRLAFAPPCRPEQWNTFHTFVVQLDRRDELQTHLTGRGIGSAIHYPIPIHLQPAARNLGYRRGDFPVAERQAGRILSLPVHQFLTTDHLARVVDAIHGFYR